MIDTRIQGSYILNIANLTMPTIQMKTISATDAKNRFGELMSIISARPVAITKNNKVVAFLMPSPQSHVKQDEVFLNKILSEYSNGNVSRKQVEEETGLWFGEILNEMAKRELSLPRVDTTLRFNEHQMTLFKRIFPAIKFH